MSSATSRYSQKELTSQRHLAASLLETLVQASLSYKKQGEYFDLILLKVGQQCLTSLALLGYTAPQSKNELTALLVGLNVRHWMGYEIVHNAHGLEELWQFALHADGISVRMESERERLESSPKS